MTGELPLRIVIVGPPPGVAIQMQRGRFELLAPSRNTSKALSFDFTIRLGEPKTPSTLRFLGEFAQGPVGARFVYVNSGTSAGDFASPWTRRAKVPLGGITPALARQVLARPGFVLEARIAGLARDGGPMCATVPLLEGGWRVVAAR
jgi:hypothetical protein